MELNQMFVIENFKPLNIQKFKFLTDKTLRVSFKFTIKLAYKTVTLRNLLRIPLVVFRGNPNENQSPWKTFSFLLSFSRMNDKRIWKKSYNMVQFLCSENNKILSGGKGNERRKMEWNGIFFYIKRKEMKNFSLVLWFLVKRKNADFFLLGIEGWLMNVSQDR